jgi:hypothetical protein
MVDEPHDPRQRLRGLNRADFNPEDPTSQGWEVLSSACEKLRTDSAVLAHSRDMFALMERMEDVDLGSPGPLVHALESTGAAYEPGLMESVRRKPSSLSVWMVNRILNTTRVDRAAWLDLLAVAATHPLASDTTRSAAKAFLAHQAAQGR